MKISQNSDYRWCSECNTLHVCLFDWKNTDDTCCGKATNRRGGDGVIQCECCQGDKTTLRGRAEPQFNDKLGYTLCWECEATINWWLEVTA